MDWALPIGGCISSPSPSRPSRWRICWGRGAPPRTSSDECLGRTLDWLYVHDPTALFAGIATQPRQRLGLSARELPVDTTAFSVSGEYAPSEDGHQGGDLDAQAIAITSGYSRAHRQDRKHWRLWRW